MLKMFVYVANRAWLIITIYVSSILFAAMLFSHFEENRSLGDGIWWACVTALTIGYGDLFPITTGGRITGIIMGHMWVYTMVPIIASHILLRMMEDKNAYTHNEQEWFEDSLQAIAGKVGVSLPEPPKDY